MVFLRHQKIILDGIKNYTNDYNLSDGHCATSVIGGPNGQVELQGKDHGSITTEECENIPYAYEEEIEDLLEKNIEILERDAFIIGRQVETGYGKWIDLVAMDKDANIIIIELKKATTDHYVMSQIFEYWPWVEKLKQEEILGLDSHMK